MTKPNTTRIAVILDASSSMSRIDEATITALNKFLDDQRAVTTDVATLSLTQFSDEFTTTPATLLADVPAITLLRMSDVRAQLLKAEKSAWSYRASGNTYLYGTIVQVIETLGAELAAMAEDERPADVMVVIQTDGDDNRSSRDERAKARQMIKHQQDVYNWRFLFIGANIDVDAASETLGIPLGQTLRYTADAAGASASMGVMSKSVGGYRSSRDAAYLSVRGTGNEGIAGTSSPDAAAAAVVVPGDLVGNMVGSGSGTSST